jgi:predicted nuclease with TOPRIM domain
MPVDMNHVVQLQVERDLERLSDRLDEYLEEGDTVLGGMVRELSGDVEDLTDEVRELRTRLEQLEGKHKRLALILMEALNEL